MVLVGDRRVGFDFLFGIDTPAVWIQQVGVGEPRRNRTSTASAVKSVRTKPESMMVFLTGQDRCSKFPES